MEYVVWTICFVLICAILLSIYLSNHLKKKRLSSDDVQEKLLQILAFQKIILKARNGYIRNSEKNSIKNEYQALYEKLVDKYYSWIKNEEIENFISTYSQFDEKIEAWNEEYVLRELNMNEAYFSDIDGRSLDEQQRIAVVVDEDNNLVIAGAGSGKTLTICAKVRYLVEKKNVDPRDILLISYTRKAVEELKERVNESLGMKIQTQTFHGLGISIIAKSETQRPDVFAGEIASVIKKYFSEVITIRSEEKEAVVKFLSMYQFLVKDPDEFSSYGDICDYYKSIDLFTIKAKVEEKVSNKKKEKTTILGESVKSLEEVMIANYLYLHGIRYTYEKPYAFQDPDQYRKKYRPDFYLEDYDIYLEHFGITKDNKVPWLSSSEEKKYIDSMRWKINTHKKNKTTLIETYSYFQKEGVLYTELDRLLKLHDVQNYPVDYENIYKILFSEKDDKYLNEFKKLIGAFITLFKAREYSEKDFSQLEKSAIAIENCYFRTRAVDFLHIVKPIYLYYENYLKSIQKIDFNDMINLASHAIRDDKVVVSYRYVILDEYQDISYNRFRLIYEIKRKTDAIIMAVGDDWQSIYRFAGSDINLFTSFEKTFGYSKILKIEKTYRNSQQLIDIAGKFVMSNPLQFRKNLVSFKDHKKPVRIMGYNADINATIGRVIDEIVYSFGENAEILMLGRHKFDFDMLSESDKFVVDRTGKTIIVKYIKYPNLLLRALTVHQSKGLESDNVIIINLKNHIFGFPNRIADDPILDLVLGDADHYTFSEERRLFYVALTRTKHTVYLITPDKSHSPFIDELLGWGKKDLVYEKPLTEDTIQDNPLCYFCQKGHLVRRTNGATGNEFVGCSNYPMCKVTINDTRVLYSKIRCNKCGGYMIKRKGEYGEFYGCTGYPNCNNTKKI